jgi:hypothetical protein
MWTVHTAPYEDIPATSNAVSNAEEFFVAISASGASTAEGSAKKADPNSSLPLAHQLAGIRHAGFDASALENVRFRNGSEKTTCDDETLGLALVGDRPGHGLWAAGICRKVPHGAFISRQGDVCGGSYHVSSETSYSFQLECRDGRALVFGRTPPSYRTCSGN